MTITLPPDQLAWIEARIATGDFSDVNTAVSCLLANAMAEREDLEAIDLSWAKPLVDEALAEVERGETIPLDQFEQWLGERMAALDA